MMAAPFFQARISGFLFEGLLTREGPVIQRAQYPGYAVLGPRCAMNQLDPGESWISRAVPKDSWWITHGGLTPQVQLSGLSEDARQELCALFGIRPFTRERYLDSFYISPAFEGLVSWVRSHQTTALRLSAFCHEVPDWYAYAIAA